MRKNNLAPWIILGLFCILVFSLFQNQKTQENSTQISYSELYSDIEQNKVDKVDIQQNNVLGTFKDGTTFNTRIPNNDPNLIETLRKYGVHIEIKKEDNSGFIWTSILSLLPMIFLVLLWLYFIRSIGSGGNKAMGFGRSRAKKLTEKKGRVTFKDVAGVEEAKEEVSEVVEFLKDPQRFNRLGGKIPKGVLLLGPPGTGKTLLGRAIAGEASVPFFSISGSEFVEMFVGVGASRVRDLFNQGKKSAPCIIFIDEIDAVGRHRGAGLGGGNDEREQTLNQLLVEMDGFASNEGVIILAATNRPDVLDPALLRPGRFDRQVIVPLPDIVGREKILKVHLRKVPCGATIDPHVIARGTPGFSGADLENVVNEAALLAAKRNKRVVTMRELEDAKEKVMMGAERRSMVIRDEDKKLTAYHEAGHAVVAINLKHSHPIHKATIIPRGQALGMVVRLPEHDQVSVSFARLKADLAVAMGGRIAEEMIFGAELVTTGASSDIQHATKLARHMVTQWGMSEKMGPLAYAEPSQEVFLGHSVTQRKSISDQTSLNVDVEVKRIVLEGYKTATTILKKQKKSLVNVAEALLKYETLTGEEVKLISQGKTIERSTYEEPKPVKTTSIPHEVNNN